MSKRRLCATNILERNGIFDSMIWTTMTFRQIVHDFYSSLHKSATTPRYFVLEFVIQEFINGPIHFQIPTSVSSILMQTKCSTYYILCPKEYFNVGNSK